MTYPGAQWTARPTLTVHLRAFALKKRTREAMRLYKHNKIFRQGHSPEERGRCGRATIIVLWRAALLAAGLLRPGRWRALGRIGARRSWPQCAQVGWSMGRAFFDRHSSGAVKLGDAAVLSALFCFCGRGRPRAFWQIWRAALLAAGLLRPEGRTPVQQFL